MTKEKVLLSHGSGGRMSRELIEQEIVSRFGDGPLRTLPDAATLVLACISHTPSAARADGTESTSDFRPSRPTQCTSTASPGSTENPRISGTLDPLATKECEKCRLGPKSLVFSTDSFVVSPLFFPGGNIGDLAVYGTVNDIAVCGGRPLWLALSMILEEGLELETLRQVLDAVRDAATRCSVAVVTGDTKVVRRGQCDGMYLTSAGIGELIAGFELGEDKVQPGDVVLASGTLGDHGMAVMAVREGIQFKDGPISDSGPVHGLVLALGELSRAVRVMRDPTRGGAASVLNELVSGRKVDLLLEEKNLPIAGNTHAVAELLGFDLLHVASEGRLLAICDSEAAGAILDKWRALPEGRDAAVIGTVHKGEGRVIINTLIGGKRLVTVPEGELLPRIC